MAESVPPTERRYMNRAEVADLIRSTPGSVAVLTSKRKIPHLKRGSRVLYDREEIEIWLSARRVPVEVSR